MHGRRAPDAGRVPNLRREGRTMDVVGFSVFLRLVLASYCIIPLLARSAALGLPVTAGNQLAAHPGQ